MLQNPTKTFIALTALVCVTVLISVRAINSEAGMPIITMIVGYAIGNGIGRPKE